MGSKPAYRRTEVTVETDRIVTIRRRQSLRVWCGECGSVVDAIGVEEAGALSGGNQPKLQDQIGQDQSGQDQAGAVGWHVCEGWDGEMLICLDSVLKSL
jgi:hypothetical protein